MEKRSPLVSIGMPVSNEERFLDVAIEALLSQTMGDFELIISDNGSTDSTAEICLSHAARDSRIQYQRVNSNMGALTNFNRVFLLSKGQYFGWAAGHDLWDQTYLERCLEPLEADGDVVISFPQTRFIDANSKLLEMPGDWLFDTRYTWGRISRYLTFIWSCPSSVLVYGLIRSSALAKTSLFRKTIAPDLILLAELSLLGTFAQIPEPLFSLRYQRGEESWAEKVERYNQSLVSDGERIFRLPVTGLAYEFLKLPLRAELTWGHKFLLLWSTVPFVLLKWGQLMKNDFRVLGKRALAEPSSSNEALSLRQVLGSGPPDSMPSGKDEQPST